MRNRSLVLVFIALLGVACGAKSSVVASVSASSPVTVTSPSPSPLDVPKDCRPDGSALQISAKGTAWVTPEGHDMTPPACLAAPAGTFTITLHNELLGNGFPAMSHNLSIYTDSSAGNSLFQGELVPGGKSLTYHVSSLAAGVYFFRCDVHPLEMTGVLVVK